MALRYFQQQEQSYVPTYAPIQPEIMSRTHRQIQQQGETFRQNKRDMLDLAAENAISEFSTLPQQDRQYARERFEKARQNIRGIVEERGARNAMPFLDEEVRGVERDLQYHRLAAQENKKIQEDLQDSKAGPGIVSYIQRKPAEVEFDENGDPISVKGGVNQEELLTARNWKAFDEGASSFVSDWKANKVNRDQFAEGYVVSTSNEQVTQDEVLNATMQYFLNDEQYRSQLELKGKKLLDENVPQSADGIYQDDHLNMDILQNEAGDVTGIETKVHEYERNDDGTFKRNENGEKIVKNTYTTQHNSIAEWQAFQQAQPYAERESYRDVGMTVKSSPLSSGTSGEDEDQGNPYTTGTWGVSEPETTYDQAWKNRMSEYEKEASQRFSTQKAKLAQAASLGAGGGEVSVKVRNGEVTMNRKVENEQGHMVSKKVTEDDIDPKFLPQFKDMKANLIQEDRALHNEAKRFKSIRKAAQQNLQRLYPKISHSLAITDQGEVEFKDSAEAEEIVDVVRQEKPSNIKEYDPYVLKDVDPDNPGREKVKRDQQFDDLQEGEYMLAEIDSQRATEGPSYKALKEQGYKEGTIPELESDRQEVIVFREGDKVKYINTDQTDALSGIRKNAEKFLDKSTNNMFKTGQKKEYNIAYINDDAKKGTVDSEINAFFDSKPLNSLGGTFRDTNDPDNKITPEAGAFFDPIGTFHRNGETVVAGAYYPSGKEDTDADEVRNVIYEGSLSESIGQKRESSDVTLSRFDQQFRNSLAPIVHEGQATMNISPREQKQMGLETNGEADFKKLNIEQDSRMVNVGTDNFDNISVYTLNYETKDGEAGSFSADTITEIEDRVLSLIQ